MLQEWLLPLFAPRAAIDPAYDLPNRLEAFLDTRVTCLIASCNSKGEKMKVRKMLTGSGLTSRA